MVTNLRDLPAGVLASLVQSPSQIPLFFSSLSKCLYQSSVYHMDSGNVQPGVPGYWISPLANYPSTCTSINADILSSLDLKLNLLLYTFGCWGGNAGKGRLHLARNQQRVLPHQMGLIKILVLRKHMTQKTAVEDTGNISSVF